MKPAWEIALDEFIGLWVSKKKAERKGLTMTLRRETEDVKAAIRAAIAKGDR